MQILPDSTDRGVAIDKLAERRLRESPYFFLKRISCRFDSGKLTLSGQVPHFQLKHHAERIVARVEGVKTVDNQVIVFDPAASPSGSPGARNAG